MGFNASDESNDGRLDPVTDNITNTFVSFHYSPSSVVFPRQDRVIPLFPIPLPAPCTVHGHRSCSRSSS